MADFTLLGNIWRATAYPILRNAGIPIKKEYTYEEIDRYPELRKAVQEGYYNVWSYMYVNSVDGADRWASTREDMLLFLREYIAEMWYDLRKRFTDDKDRKGKVWFDPYYMQVETRTILNLDDIIAGRTFVPVYAESSTRG